MSIYESWGVLCRSNVSNARQPMDLQGVSTFVKYGSEVLMGFTSKKVCDLAAKAGRPVESMPSKTIALTKVVNELKMMVCGKSIFVQIIYC